MLSIVGLKLIRAESDTARTGVVFIALGICIAAAYILYVLVERRSQQWASRISYKRPERRDAPEAVSGLAPATMFASSSADRTLRPFGYPLRASHNSLTREGRSVRRHAARLDA